jgi:hypothetical protein
VPVVDVASAVFVQHKSIASALVIQLSVLKTPHKMMPCESNKPFKKGEIPCGACGQDLGNVQNNVGAEGYRGTEVGLLKHASLEFPLPMGGATQFVKLNAKAIRAAVGEGATTTPMSSDVVRAASLAWKTPSSRAGEGTTAAQPPPLDLGERRRLELAAKDVAQTSWESWLAAQPQSSEERSGVVMKIFSDQRYGFIEGPGHRDKGIFFHFTG